jgi:hypothetical protein
VKKIVGGLWWDIGLSLHTLSLFGSHIEIAESNLSCNVISTVELFISPLVFVLAFDESLQVQAREWQHCIPSSCLIHGIFEVKHLRSGLKRMLLSPSTIENYHAYNSARSPHQFPCNPTPILPLHVTSADSRQHWEFLAAHQRATAVDLIYKLNGPLLDNVNKKEFFTVNYLNPDDQNKWIYNKLNAYNSSTTTSTIIHLIQKVNTLQADVDISAQAIFLWQNQDGTPITESNKLIMCSKYGNPGRNSDPRVNNYSSHRLLTITAYVTIDWLYH